MKIKLKILVLVFLMLTFLATNIYAVDMFLTSTNSGSEGSVVTSPSPEDEISENEVLLSETNITTDNTDSETFNDDDVLLFDDNSEELVDNEIYDNSDTVQDPVADSVSTSSPNTLSVSDIINIILIALSIVLIFLAVAILIKLK